MLIASIPKGYCSAGRCGWVDWLGDTDGTTKYVVAAVDTQGNISASNFVTTQSYCHHGAEGCDPSPDTAANGQYWIQWDDMYEAYYSSSSTGGQGFTLQGGTLQ